MFSIFPIFLCIFIIQMPSMIDCMPMPMPIDNSIDGIRPLSNSTYQFPCFPPIDFETQKGPPHVNDQEFKECMQAKIDKISWLDNQSRALFQKVDKYGNSTIKPSTEEEIEMRNQLFAILDRNKVKKTLFSFLKF